MRVKADLEAKPFGVPNYVILTGEQGDGTHVSVKLSALDESTLSMLCDDFRARIFEAAGKTDPRLK